MATLYPADTSNGEVTSYVPLTTIFKPSSSCSTIFRQDGPSYVAYDPGYGLDINSHVICQPPAVTTWWEQGNLGNAGSMHTAVSLGPLTCPFSWITVATSVKDTSSTAAMCCPPGFYLADGITGEVVGACLSTVNSGDLGIWAYTDDGSEVGTAWTVTTSTADASSTVGAIAIVGWNIKQVASSTTPSTSSTSTTPSAATKPAYPAITKTPSGSASDSNTSTGNSSTSTPAVLKSSAAVMQDTGSQTGLSTGATIGIGVGVALGVIGIAAMVVAIWLIKRRQKRQNQADETQDHHLDADSKPPLPKYESASGLPAKHELPWESATHELEGPSTDVSELENRAWAKTPYEMAA